MIRSPLSTPTKTPRSWLPLCLVLGAVGCAAAPPPVESAEAASPPAEPAPTADMAPAPAAEPSPVAAPAAAEPADSRGKEQIQAVLAGNRERVRACYDAAQKNNPGIQGDLVVAFVINPDGVIKTAEVHSNEIARDVKETLRKLKAAQYTAAHPGEVCPAKWQEGEKTLAPSLDLVGKI